MKLQQIHSILPRLLAVLLVMMAARAGCGTMRAQTVADNYVLTRTMLTSDGSESLTKVTYFDGLGREVCTVVESASPLAPVASVLEYSALGRVARQGQPFPSASLDMVGFDAGITAAASYYSDSLAWTETELDALDRPVRTWGPGAAWSQAGRSVHTTYRVNTTSEVKRYRLSQSSSPVQDGCYPAGSLTCELVTDEDGRTLSRYTDLYGRLVLERRGTENDTYYVYNSVGQLRYVLQPQYQEEPDVSLYAFVYDYDDLGNMIEQTPPGCDPVYHWYDSSRRLAFTQDGQLRERGRMRFFLYDNLGRPVVTGTCQAFGPGSDYSAGAVIDGTVASVSLGGYMATTASVLSAVRLETARYYDSYGFINFLEQSYPAAGYDRLRNTSQAWSNGMLTGTLSTASDGELLLSANYYSRRGQVVRNISIGLDGRAVTTDNTYDFAGRPVSTTVSAQTGGGGVVFVSENSYHPHGAQLSQTTVSLSAGSGMCSGIAGVYSYDGTGYLSAVNSGAGAGTVSYNRNIRGWCTGITGPGFTETLHYTDGPGTPMYSSLISSQEWRANDRKTRRYRYSYDELGRLTDATYSGTGTLAARYDEKVTGYNANGSILGLLRWGTRTTGGATGLVDNLEIEYDGNRLRRVTDSASSVTLPGSMDFYDGADLDTEYHYNGSGALVADANKGISLIEYDDCGFPRLVQFANGCQTRYVYSPDGRKLRQTHITAVEGVTVPTLQHVEMGTPLIAAVDSTDYVDNLVIRDGNLEMCLFDGGYIGRSSGASGWKMHYYTPDHLGNNRAVVDSDGTIEQVTHYYPFGGVFAGVGTGQGLQPYKYNGKELDRMHGLDLYDYCFRFYDPALPGWDRVDRMAEKHYNLSPYVYCMGNPVNYIDPIGCDTVRVKYADNIWTISEIKVVEGTDVFILCDDSKSAIYRYDEGKYGNRVCALNLENAGEGSYNLGVYHVSGQSTDATGFYVTPGGAASNVNNSGKRIKDGTYPIVAPHENALWRTPGVGGEVKDRGIRFHYGGSNPLKWTQGCFVLFPDYSIENNSIRINPQESKKASSNFNNALGASGEIKYEYKKDKYRTGAVFPNGINYQLLLKTR